MACRQVGGGCVIGNSSSSAIRQHCTDGVIAWHTVMEMMSNRGDSERERERGSGL